ncbi:MAG: glycoside hydrolase family 13 protein [Treponema sp.]
MLHWLDTVYSDSGAVFVSNPAPRHGETVTVRLRLLNNNEIKHVYLRLKVFGVEQLLPMQKEKEKNNLIYYKTDIVCNERRMQYQFYLATSTKIYYYTQHRITDYMPDESRDFVILTEYKQPAWVGKSVCYQIMTDRFRNGRPELTVQTGAYTYQGHQPMQIKNWNSEPLPYSKAHCMDFYGGDLYGIIEKLDYLQDLGISVLYLNPIFTAPTIHKYDCLDYFEVDPHFGGNEAFAALCQEIHRRGMKIILDISINHTSSAAKWFNKSNEFYPSEIGAYQNKDCAERDYYFIDENGGYETWAGVETMPKLNYIGSRLRDIIYRKPDSVLKKWIQPPYSIDGWRFDVADCMARSVQADCYHEVWKEINQELKRLNPELLILAEDWSDCSGMFNGDEWDSTMNYFGSARPLREFAGEKDLLTSRNAVLNTIDTVLTAEQLKERILQFYAAMPTAAAHQMFNLLGSHDVARLYNNPAINLAHYKGAVTALYGLPGMVNIYYGDEIMLPGRIADIFEGCRFPMDWDSPLRGEKAEIFNLYRALNSLKKESAALQYGGFKAVFAQGTVFAFSRFTEDEALIFVWSVSPQPEYIVLGGAEFGLPSAAVQLLIGSVREWYVQASNLSICLEPCGSTVLHIIPS